MTTEMQNEIVWENVVLSSQVAELRELLAKIRTRRVIPVAEIDTALNRSTPERVAEVERALKVVRV